MTEVPYQTNKAALLERTAALVNDKKIAGVWDLRDESDRDGVRIVVSSPLRHTSCSFISPSVLSANRNKTHRNEMCASVLLPLFFLWAWVCGSFLRQCVRILRGICATFSIESRLLVCHLSIDQIELKRDAVPEVVLNNLFQKTQLQSSFSGNFLAIVNSGSTPGRFTLRESLEQFLAFRFETIRRRAAHRLEVCCGLHIANDQREKLLRCLPFHPAALVTWKDCKRLS